MSDSREAGLNQEQRTKNQELPKTPALQTAGFFIIQSIPLLLA